MYEILGNDNSGHGNDHISRVLRMSLKFSEKENSNKEVVSLIALLHDVDDYKLVGQENSKAQTNTKRILDEVGVSKEIKEHVLSELQSIGYSNLLKPSSIVITVLFSGILILPCKNNSKSFIFKVK